MGFQQLPLKCRNEEMVKQVAEILEKEKEVSMRELREKYFEGFDVRMIRNALGKLEEIGAIKFGYKKIPMLVRNPVIEWTWEGYDGNVGEG